MCLIAASGWWDITLFILQAALGLGAVIFVHELGHFVVAKMCGVKCEKFYIGFDVPLRLGKLRLPSALWRHRWGETEYGIGILPLGGYVKMLGQDDNPARIAEEIERSRVSQPQGGGELAISQPEAEAKEIVGPNGERYLVDRRSYLAKSVPQRMAIISAGVVMNVIFAFLFAVFAYGIGVPYVPCIISATAPGSPAWENNLQVGAEIVQLEGKSQPSFEDLRSGVTLSDLENGVPMVLQPPGQAEARQLTLRPRKRTGLAQIGVSPALALRLHQYYPVYPSTPAARARPIRASAKTTPQTFLPGDEIVRVNDKEVKTYAQFSSILAGSPGEALEVTIQRGGEAPEDNEYAPRKGGRELTFLVQPKPMKRLGLVMEMGNVVAVQQGSVLAERIREGDFIESMDGEPIGDPVAWVERVRQRAVAGEYIKLVVRRKTKDGEDEEVEIDNILPREPEHLQLPPSSGAPLACPSLGIAYRVLNRVRDVATDSPAARAGLEPQDEIVAARVIVGKDAKPPLNKFEAIAFGEEQHNWPTFVSMLQMLSDDSQVELTVKRRSGGSSEETLKLKVKPEVLPGSPEVYDPDRGFSFEYVWRIRRAESIGEAVQLGFDKTTDSLMLVYRFLHRLVTRQVPLRALGGPITIAKVSYYSAFQGPGKLLIFLTLLSANLAVINFLPIPLLDGGHMVFLAYEGIRRRPPGEKFVVAMHTIGFAFIVSLMLFVIALDVGLIPRNL